MLVSCYHHSWFARTHIPQCDLMFTQMKHPTVTCQWLQDWIRLGTLVWTELNLLLASLLHLHLHVDTLHLNCRLNFKIFQIFFCNRANVTQHSPYNFLILVAHSLGLGRVLQNNIVFQDTPLAGSWSTSYSESNQLLAYNFWLRPITIQGTGKNVNQVDVARRRMEWWQPCYSSPLDLVYSQGDGINVEFQLVYCKVCTTRVVPLQL